jgi:imidazolonepropionase-like amidohydrolase
MRSILLLAVMMLAFPLAAASQTTVFEIDRLYESAHSEPLTNAVVVVTDGKIAAVGKRGTVQIPAGAHVIKATGMSAMAGFWNCHVHFIEDKFTAAGRLPAATLSAQMRAMLTRYGFVYAYETASFDVQNTLAIRERIRRGEVSGPIIFTVGAALVPPRGKPGYLRHRYFPEVGRPEDARELVRQQARAGADGIKFFSGSPTSNGVVLMPAGVALAVTDAAHERKLPVFAHPTTTPGVEVALAAGVDILAHVSPEDMRPWSDDLIARLRARDVALIPTLKVYRWDPHRQGVSKGYIERLTRTSAAQLGRYSAAGGTILFGTDVGYMTDYDPTEEFELMSRAGMTFQQILASLTTAPAERFGLSGRTGRIAPGMDADLVLVEGDPREQVAAFAAAQYTMLRGTTLYNPRKL